MPNLSPQTVEFLDRWQTLLGTAFGLFFAVMIPVLGFFLKEIYKRNHVKIESFRRTEISLSQTATHILTTVEQLDDFIERVERTIVRIKSEKNAKLYSLDETNFPPIITIGFEEEMQKTKLSSNYLHNKLLIIEYLVRWANGTISRLDREYEKLLTKNVLLIEKLDPQSQRAAYGQHLEGFLTMVKMFNITLRGNQLDNVFEAKAYNLKLMKNWPLVIWRYESTSLKFFRNKAEMVNYRKPYETIDRINELIAQDVKNIRQEMVNRASDNTNSTNASPPPSPSAEQNS